MLKISEFSSVEDGPNILIMGAVHGNEPCGTLAINKFISELDKGEIVLKKGRVTFIPISNPKAFELGKRYIDTNLNRVIKDDPILGLYENNIAKILCHYIKQSQIVIDLHSFKTQGEPFVFQDYLDKETEFMAKSLGLKNIIQGWAELYQNTDMSDTIGYAHSKGIKGLVVECGVNGSSESNIIAYNSIRNLLGLFNMIDHMPDFIGNYNIIRVNEVYFKQKPGKLLQEFKHMDTLTKGQLIGVYDDGEEVRSPNDGNILLPFSEAKVGEEWFYYGIK